MKIRNGFVSNSSSSSFIINTQSEYYNDLSIEDVTDIMDKLLEVVKIYKDIQDNVYTIELLPNNSKIIKKRKEYGYEDHIEVIDNQIIYIESTDDNSIPYFIQQFLEDELNATRLYWG